MMKIGASLVGAAAGAITGDSTQDTGMGANIGYIAETNNRMAHQTNHDMVKKNAKLVAEKLGISEQEAEARIIAEVQRNSDQQTAEASGGKHDYEIRSIIGCSLLNCDGSETDPHYADHNYNSQFIAPNQVAYDAAQGQLGTGKTSDQLATDNVTNNPVSTGIAGAAMVGYGVLTGGTSTALGIKVLGAGIGAAVNAAFQSVGEQAINWVDVGMAAITGFFTTGSGFISSISTNVGGAIIVSASNGENPNPGVIGAGTGTILGYGIGKSIEVPLNNYLNPWYRPDWKDAGVGLGIVTSNPTSPMPGMMGNMFSSGGQEIAENQTIEMIKKDNKK